jgi:hypothetical protein
LFKQIVAYSEYTGGTHFPHFNASDDIVPPWLYSNDQQCKIDAHINCIVVPSSLSNEFAFNYIFQQTGFLRCADIILSLYFFRLPGGPRNKTPKNRNAFDEEDEDDQDIVFPRSSSTR